MKKNTILSETNFIVFRNSKFEHLKKMQKAIIEFF